MKDMVLGDIIASRGLHLLDAPGQGITIQIGKPTPYPDLKDYLCPYQIIGLGDEKIRHCSGIDAMQALELVLSILQVELSVLLEDYPLLRWADAPPGDFGFKRSDT